MLRLMIKMDKLVIKEMARNKIVNMNQSWNQIMSFAS